MRRVQVLSVPTEPVTLTELKAHLRISGTAEDDLLTAFITAARIMCEKLTRRTIPSTQMALWLDNWPCESIGWHDGVREGPVTGERSDNVEIPRPPLISVESVKTYGMDDTAAIMAAGLYYVSKGDADQCGRVVLRNLATWPVALRSADAVEIAFTAGYTAVPEPLKLAIKMMASHMYANRGECSAEECAGQCGASMILSAYKIERLIL